MVDPRSFLLGAVAGATVMVVLILTAASLAMAGREDGAPPPPHPETGDRVLMPDGTERVFAYGSWQRVAPEPLTTNRDPRRPA